VSLDAIVIADFAVESVSGSNPLRFTLGGRTPDVQVVLNYLKHNGQIVLPIEGDNTMSWSSAPRLNGVFLFSWLREHNFKVELIDDYYVEKDYFSNLLRHSPRVVIISTTFIYRKDQLLKLVAEIRSLAPEIYIIAGGPFVYLSYLIYQRSGEDLYNSKELKDDFLFLDNTDPSVDLYIVSPRGEEILCEVLEKITKGGSLDYIPNLAYRRGKSYYFSRRIDDITNAPAPYIEWDSLPDSIFKSGVLPMQASIGCPYRCAFCNFTKDRRLMFLKPLDQLIDELKTVSDRGIRYVWFVDDNFRLGAKDLSMVCERLVSEDLGINWMSFFRADSLKNIDFSLLRAAGCRGVQLGLESADLQILKNMNKKAHPTMYAKVVRGILGAGINCSCYFIFGFPGETTETATRTIAFLKAIEYPEAEGILSWSMYPFMLAPLSPIFELDMRKKYGLDGYMFNWEHHTMDFDKAREYIRKAFVELENSGPIYRGDNQDFLLKLTRTQRQEFVRARHRLSKLAVIGRLGDHDILQSFSEIFPQSKSTQKV
jgi:anaerobic magnesium-protoporphyrin IX monomethyl ester cyclase